MADRRWIAIGVIGVMACIGLGPGLWTSAGGLAALHQVTGRGRDVIKEFEGLCGASLKQAVRRSSVPSSLPGAIVGQGSVWAAFRTTDNIVDEETGGIFVFDRFGDVLVAFPADGVSSPSEMRELHAMQPLWWDNSPDVRQEVECDLHGLYPCNKEVVSEREGHIPGEVGLTSFDNGHITIGKTEVSGAGASISTWMPANEYRGDIARAIFYMVTRYPVSLWHGTAVGFLADNDYPTLNRYGSALLLDWHRKDPVSDEERRRNDAVAQVQGNRNLFIDYPELAEHIWGEKSETPIVGNESDEPSQEHRHTPLKPSYVVSEQAICLVSPFVPDDAVWSVNGKPVSTDHLSPQELGIGKHELSFLATKRKGRIVIEITE